MKQFILASQSPRRKQLLEWAELPFEVVVVPTEENYPASMAVEEVPVFIAKNKALAVKEKVAADAVIIAADTIVVLNDTIIGKPADREEAIAILSALSGQMHRVITGVTILANETVTAFSDITDVQFYPLTQEQIVFYVDKYKPYDKAGAYAIQEWIGVTGIQSIRGDFYNVMGLPVSRVMQALASL